MKLSPLSHRTENTLFCSAQAKEIPKDFKSVKYSLCSISFDPETRRFGHQVDTLYSSEQATVQITGAEHKSASFPRVSPDGKQLVFTLSEYGNFSIWHKDADLYRIDLDSGVMHRMDEVNSNDVESYHSWSSNSRWLVFSSRRIDGLYTRPYLVHIDENGKQENLLSSRKKTLISTHASCSHIIFLNL